MIRFLIWLVALGFFVEEVPRAIRRRRARAERLRIERAREVARLALAINLNWREFGCSRAMTSAEIDQAELLPHRGMMV